MNESLFSDCGLTLQEANSLRQKCETHINEERGKWPSGLTFCDENVLLKGKYDYKLAGGYTGDVYEIVNSARRTMEWSALNAYLATAISRILEKVKEVGKTTYEAWIETRIPDKAKRPKSFFSFEDWCSSENIECPCPVDEQSVRDEMTVKQLAEYLSLEAEAAVLGKFVNKDGYLDRPRKELARVLVTASMLEGEGQNARLYTYKPTQHYEDVDRQYVEMARKYRQVESALNQRKVAMHRKVYGRNSQIREQVDELRRRYNEAAEKARKEFDEIYSEFLKWRRNEMTRIDELRISIPERFKDLVNEA